MLKTCCAADAVADACLAYVHSNPELKGTKSFESSIQRLANLLEPIYGDAEGFFDEFTEFCGSLGRAAAERPGCLRELDKHRSERPGWFVEDRLVGYMAYVDRFGTDLRGVVERIPYLKSFGVGYLHLLPFLKTRAGSNDGGFAVSSFEEIEPALGTMSDLENLCMHLREAEISLCADLVLNHVSDDHPWAKAAASSHLRYRQFFHVFGDRNQCDAYEAHLDEVFPETAPGNFTFVPAMESWVWTTFNPYQWDLNYSHFPVFVAMVKAMLDLANRGVEVFRLDSAPFLWKRAGTTCTNQPEVHRILQALRAVTDLVAPGVLLKAEAIMPAAQLAPYLGDSEANECHLAYHSSLMAAGWAALAEQRADLVHAVIRSMPPLPADTGWLTYVRCHDDIVWGVLKSEVDSIGGSFVERIGSVAAFMEGRAPGSYARGVSFQTGASRQLHGTNGTASALVGFPGRTMQEQQRAIDRLALLYGLACWVGAIPMICMGDELGQDNNTHPDDSQNIAADSRWIGRPYFDNARKRSMDIPGSEAAQISTVMRLILAARADPRLDLQAPLVVAQSSHAGLLVLRRGTTGEAWFNFSGKPIDCQIPADGTNGADKVLYGKSGTALPPYGMTWIARR